MKSHPPNIPDFNVLDLQCSHYNNAVNVVAMQSMQSLQHQALPNNIDELIKAVNIAFANISPECWTVHFCNLNKLC